MDKERKSFEEEILERSSYYNMRKVCEEAGVSNQTWRKFACGSQNISLKKLIAIKETMDRV